jgi:hypothetical protein
MRAIALILLLATGCSALLQVRGTPQQRDTVYAVVGTFVAMAVLAALLVPGSTHEPAMPHAPHAPTLGR